MNKTGKLQARPPKPQGDSVTPADFIGGAGAEDESGQYPWTTPEAIALASSNKHFKLVNIRVAYDYGLKLKFLKQNGVNLHQLLLNKALDAIDEEVSLRLKSTSKKQ